MVKQIITPLNKSVRQKHLSPLKGCKKVPLEQQALYDRQTIAFYDIDKKGWRSMRIDTIWSYCRALKLTYKETEKRSKKE